LNVYVRSNVSSEQLYKVVMKTAAVTDRKIGWRVRKSTEFIADVSQSDVTVTCCDH
jgi:hypothetical protein